MKATGIARRIDDLGRVVLPIELRRVLGMSDKEPLEIYTEDGSIVLKKYKPDCAFCGSVEDVRVVNGTKVCAICAGNMMSLYEKGGK